MEDFEQLLELKDLKHLKKAVGYTQERVCPIQKLLQRLGKALGTRDREPAANEICRC